MSASTLILKKALTGKERKEVMNLLQAQNLPVTDIKEDTLLYILLDDATPVGTAGLDIFDDCALLRSISVTGKLRGKGYGRILNEQVERFAKDSGIKCMYLITHTARDFFDRQGYCVIDRTAAPDVIKQTEQFTGICPSSAVVMKKRI